MVFFEVPNCARYVHKYELVERSAYVPRKNASVPTPEWKRELREVFARRDDPAETENIRFANAIH